MPITGGCLCGKVRYEIAVEAPMPHATMLVPPVPVSERGRRHDQCGLPQGSVASQRRDESLLVDRRQRRRLASPVSADCGTQLFSEAEPRPHLVIVRVGSLDDPEIAKPSAIIWTKIRAELGLPRSDVAADGRAAWVKRPRSVSAKPRPR